MEKNFFRSVQDFAGSIPIYAESWSVADNF